MASGSVRTMDVSFDILSVEALFLLPRLFSLLSLIPFFGTLVGSYPVNDLSFRFDADAVL